MHLNLHKSFSRTIVADRPPTPCCPRVVRYYAALSQRTYGADSGTYAPGYFTTAG